MSENLNQKCTSCGANLTFDISTQCLRCEYCGEVKSLGTFQVLGKFPLSTLDKEGNSWSGESKVMRCANCGAQEVLSMKDISAVCHFCGSYKLTETNDIPGFKPNGILPFLFTKEQIEKEFSKWIKSKRFRPNKLKQAKIATFNGVYTPCWVYDTAVNTSYSGVFYDEYKDKDGDTHKRYYNVSGTRGDVFADVAINVGGKIDEKDFNTLKPFDFTKAVPYDSAYLLGFAANHYSVDADVAFGSAKEYMEKRIKSFIIAKENADGCDKLDLHCTYFDTMYNYLLLPVWVMTYNYKNKEYRIMSNGQTGEIVGKAPRSAVKIVSAFLIAYIICTLLILFVHPSVGGTLALISTIVLIVAILVS